MAPCCTSVRQFECGEQKSAPEQVQACVRDHEAITYREKDHGGLKCGHEYNAMVEHLQRKILAVQDGNNSRGSTRPRASSLEQGRAQLKRATGQRGGETRQEPEPEPQ